MNSFKQHLVVEAKKSLLTIICTLDDNEVDFELDGELFVGANIKMQTKVNNLAGAIQDFVDEQWDKEDGFDGSERDVKNYALKMAKKIFGSEFQYEFETE